MFPTGKGAVKRGTHLTVVSVQRFQLLDVTHVDALGQRLGAHVKRGKLRQGVRRICKDKNCMKAGLQRGTEGRRILILPM